MVIPFDGYHYSLAELEASQKKQRGSPDTFDANRLYNDLQAIRSGNQAKISLPGFNYEKGDPQPDQHEFIRNEHKIIFCEGLYLLHNNDPWTNLRDLFDITVFVDADIEVCLERLKVRDIELFCPNKYTKEQIEQRVEIVDRANMLIVDKSKSRADMIVESVAQRAITTTLADGTPEEIVQVSWETDMANKIRQVVKERNENSIKNNNGQAETYMLCLVGGPGCGKTTSCTILKDLLEDLGGFIMPFDGYHKPLSVLRAQPNAKDLIYRRGAPNTFDRERLFDDLRRIKQGNAEDKIINIPGFDHAAGDPEEGAHQFDRSKHKVVICEGLYLLHDQDGWETMKSIFDYCIFVDADVDACVERLKIRNKCIPGYTEEEIEARCEDVDRANAMIVDKSKVHADLVVQSVANKVEHPLAEDEK